MAAACAPRCTPRSATPWHRRCRSPTPVNIAQWLAGMSRRLARRIPDEAYRRAPHQHPLRGHPRRTRPADGARADPGRERLPQVRDLLGGGARLHAGDAVLDQGHRPRGRQPLPHAHNLRYGCTILRHHRHRERQPLPCAGTLATAAWASRTTQPGPRRLGKALDLDAAAACLRGRFPAANGATTAR